MFLRGVLLHQELWQMNVIQPVILIPHSGLLICLLPGLYHHLLPSHVFITLSLFLWNTAVVCFGSQSLELHYLVCVYILSPV